PRPPAPARAAGPPLDPAPGRGAAGAPLSRLAHLLWGPTARLAPLLTAACLLLLVRLGRRALWTPEGRWGALCPGRGRSGRLLHPTLFGEPYDDKPPLSYWLMLGAARVRGALDELALRLPGALAGLLAVWCTCRLGMRLSGRSAGLAAGWTLATTYYFVF